MGRGQLRRLFWTGLALTTPLIVALLKFFAKPGDPEVMSEILVGGVPATPGLIFLIWWSVLRSRPRLEEDEIELGATGRPDLSRYDKPLAYYTEMYAVWTEAPGGGPKAMELAHRRRTHALWGVLAHGLDGVSFAASLIRSDRKEVRTDGLFLFHELRVLSDLDALASMDRRPWTRDALVELIDALGAVRSRQALPLLARTVDSEEPSVREATARALARVLERSFETVESAHEWLLANVATEAV
jgi:hypothetical protein